MPPLALCLFFVLILPPPRSTLFPYTTLFRSAPLARTRAKRWHPAPDRRFPDLDRRLRGPSGRPRCANRRRLYPAPDRKSTRLNSSHRTISYAVFCLKKKTQADDVRGFRPTVT